MPGDHGVVASGAGHTGTDGRHGDAGPHAVREGCRVVFGDAGLPHTDFVVLHIVTGGVVFGWQQVQCLSDVGEDLKTLVQHRVLWQRFCVCLRLTADYRVRVMECVLASGG